VKSPGGGKHKEAGGSQFTLLFQAKMSALTWYVDVFVMSEML